MGAIWRKECRNLLTSAVYYLLIVLLTVQWYQNVFSVIRQELDRANGESSAAFSLERPLLAKPTPEDASYGLTTSEEELEKIMCGAADLLLLEYENNTYAAYPLGYYKAISLDSDDQAKILNILCELTGLTPAQLENLPDGYFPAVNGTIIHYYKDTQEEWEENPDKTQVFTPQVTEARFWELMAQVEAIIDEKGSSYTRDQLIQRFGLTEMTYEDAQEEYRQTIEEDGIVGGFARLFCDYLGLILGFVPVFLAVILYLRDKRYGMISVIYGRKVSSTKLVLSRFLACVTMTLLPVLLLSLPSLMPLVRFAVEQDLSVNVLAFIQYILWWLLPTVLAVTAVGTFFTLLTDSPIAIAVQFLWWWIARSTTGLSGDTSWFALMIRHNTLRGYELIQQQTGLIWLNRLVLTVGSLAFLAVSIRLYEQKRKGKWNASSKYLQWTRFISDKLVIGPSR